MNSEASAVTTVDSAPAEVKPSTEMTSEQSAKFWETGALPLKSDSAPDKKPAVADSAPPKPPAVTRSDSAPEKDAQEPHRKPEDYGNKRFQELANENKTLKERLEALERKSAQPEKRETPPVSQPAPDEPKAPPPFRQFMEQFFADPANKGKTHEEGAEQWHAARDKFKDAQFAKQLKDAISADRNRAAQETAAKELKSKVDDANERYGKEEAGKIFPALKTVLDDQQVPYAVKAMLDRSDVLVDLMYTLASDQAEFDKFVALCKSDPGAAIEKVVVTQSLVREQLKSNGKPAPKPSSETPADKPAKPEAPVEQPKPRTPKPPAEVGGRGAVSGDAQVEAARSGNFAAFEAEQRRKYASR